MSDRNIPGSDYSPDCGLSIDSDHFQNDSPHKEAIRDSSPESKIPNAKVARPTSSNTGELVPASGEHAIVKTRVVEGAFYLWKGEIAELISAHSQIDVVVRMRESGATHRVSPRDLTMFSLPSSRATSDHERSPLGVTCTEWDTAVRRQKFISELAQNKSPLFLESTAMKLGLSTRQLRRLIRKHMLGGLGAILPRKRGPDLGSSRLHPRSLSILENVIRRQLRLTTNTTAKDVFNEVAQECEYQSIEAPSLSTVARLLAKSRLMPELLPSEIRAALKEKRRPVLAHFTVERPLMEIQIDHTAVDVLIVDNIGRNVIGRPTLTIAIDVHTRCILGMSLTLESPSVLSVALCLVHCVTPKDEWLLGMGCHGKWPMFGLPEVIHLDNAKEFHATGFLRGCDLYNIRVKYRPPATPRFGGIVERVIGTLMKRIHLLSGSTHSEILKRRPPDAEKNATFTLEEVDRYLTNEIVRYHHSPHSTLGITPAQAWERAWRSNGAILLPPAPKDPMNFLLNFLPTALRTITREGIELFGLEYWHTSLAEHIEPRTRRVVRYDPRDLSRIYVEFPSQQILTVPLRNDQFPRISLWEWREIRKIKSQKASETDSAEISRCLNENRELLQKGAKRLRTRRRMAREEKWKAAQSMAASTSEPEVLITEESPESIETLPFSTWD